MSARPHRNHHQLLHSSVTLGIAEIIGLLSQGSIASEAMGTVAKISNLLRSGRLFGPGYTSRPVQLVQPKQILTILTKDRLNMSTWVNGSSLSTCSTRDPLETLTVAQDSTGQSPTVHFFAGTTQLFRQCICVFFTCSVFRQKCFHHGWNWVSRASTHSQAPLSLSRHW